MQRDISDKNTLGDTLNSINDIRRSTAIGRITMTPKKKYKKYENSLVWENTMQI